MANQLWLPLACLAVLLSGGSVHAHGLGGDWSLKDGKILVEAFFDDDSEAQDAKVRLYDAADRIVAEGKTDAKGQCSLPSPPAGTYRLVIDAGAGHRHTQPVIIPGMTEPADATLAATTNREDMVRGLWVRAGIGVGVIGVFAVAAWVALRRKALV